MEEVAEPYAAIDKKAGGADDLLELSPAATKKPEIDEITIDLCAPSGAPVHKGAEELSRLWASAATHPKTGQK